MSAYPSKSNEFAIEIDIFNSLIGCWDIISILPDLKLKVANSQKHYLLIHTETMFHMFLLHGRKELTFKILFALMGGQGVFTPVQTH